MKTSLPQQDLEHVLANTRDVWEKLRGGNVFLTGGTGFIGSWLLETFAAANKRLGLGASMVVLTRDAGLAAKRLSVLATDRSLRLHEGDIRSFDFPKGDFSHVIHGAMPVDARSAGQTATLEIATEGTRRALELARSKKSKAFLLMSSGAVYGRLPPDLGHVGEDFAGVPDSEGRHSIYAQGKRAAEELCAKWHAQHRINAKIARCFAFVGPRLPLDAQFAAGNFIRDALAGGPIVVNGDGTPRRTYLYAADLAIWLWTILVFGKPGRPYNVGSELPVSVAELARAVADACKPRKVDVRVRQAPIPGSMPERYVPSTRRARDELKLKQLIDLGESLRRTISWHSQTP